jgi:hypothetical protein
MNRLLKPAQRGPRGVFLLIAVGLLSMLSVPRLGADSQKPAKGTGTKAAPRAVPPVAPPAPRLSWLTPEAWQNASRDPLRPGEVDELLAKEQQTTKIQPAPLTTDEQFIRRVTLDLTGQLPAPADVDAFVANPHSQKRAQLIEKLLNSDAYARHWASYWRDVMAARITDNRGLVLQKPFEEWLYRQFRDQVHWDQVAQALITANGSCRADDDGENGVVFFLGSHFGPDSADQQAAETARVFLGIQIQCAQCHDHPTDRWKRVQFHELAGYFARVRPRFLRPEKGKLAGVELTAAFRGEHTMPSPKDPNQRLVTLPRFLDGKEPGNNLDDQARRRALARAIVDKQNYWFGAAYVNRTWGELMGQSFYEPVDDIGPQKDVVFPQVLTRLTGAFRGADYDIKSLFRAVLNSKAYQRQIRLGDSADQHLHFAAAYPTRLRADALWDSLIAVLGSIGGPSKTGPFGLRQGLEGLFKREFNFDPSLKADQVEGSISQVLLMMNNPAINQRIQARGNNLLARILKTYPRDDEALRMLYLQTLARKPTDRELKKCRDYLEKISNRTEAFEDILWVLLNSTEFQTKR